VWIADLHEALQSDAQLVHGCRQAVPATWWCTVHRAHLSHSSTGKRRGKYERKIKKEERHKDNKIKTVKHEQRKRAGCMSW
jgi:hypothetical protein